MLGWIWRGWIGLRRGKDAFLRREEGLAGYVEDFWVDLEGD